MKARSKKLPKKLNGLYELARKVRENAYSPYSHCKVGAVIQTIEGDFFTGCNVENASYGATVCAERVAIQKALSEKGHLQISAIMVVTDAPTPWPPCGMCRQVISEFLPKNQTISIHVANLKGQYMLLKWDELFGQAFNPSFMKK